MDELGTLSSDSAFNYYYTRDSISLAVGESWEVQWINRLGVADFAPLFLLPPITPTPRPPTPTEVPPATGTARAALLEALDIVETLPYAGPPAIAPECPTDVIANHLLAAVDGTFTSDNALGRGQRQVYPEMSGATACLNAIVADRNVDSVVQQSAEQANALILAAARRIPASLIDGTALFGDTIPPDGSAQIQAALNEINKGDTQVSVGQHVAAIMGYRDAWLWASNGIDWLWSATDPDGDQLLDQFEETLGTSTESSDTDGDGISDGDELVLTGTDPTQADSDSDNDGDGLTAQEEVNARTNPLHPDTDRDTLDDRFELEEFGSNPLKQDTDNDGLTDDSELRLGTNPRKPDSNNNGIRDGDEIYTSTAATDEHGLEVAVDITGSGDVAGSIQFQTLISDTLFQNMPGQMTPAVDITTDEPFDNARVEVRFDPAQVPDGDVENLRILYYDDTEKVFKPTDGAHGVDTSTSTAWAETSHFTTFVLFYIPNWNTVWTYEMEPGRDPTGPVTRSLDVMLVLDSSGSMRNNDPQDLRKTAAQNFIDALLPGDQVGVVDFDSNAVLLQSLTTLTETAKTAVDQIDSNGDTCIGDGIELATQEIVANTNPESLKAQIVLTDGQDTSCIPDYPALIADANATNIQLYTIGLGSSVNTALLQQLADETGGQYFPVSSADDLPDVFRRIAEEPDPTLDTDEDGLPNWLELQGIRLGNGTIVTTNPADFDTDGDGLSDGEEVGTRQTGPDGDYYDGITNPANADSDGDFIIDSEETEMGTNPVNADTDGDSLDDLTEINADFDPLNINPDGDSFSDAEEYARDSDPFYYDLTGWEYAAAVVAGFTLGDAGQNTVDLGWLNPAYLQSFGYIAGWLASGFFVIGDIRDTLATLVRGDITDTFLNAIGLIPLLGDGTKVVRVFAKYIEWLANVRGPLARWAAKQFTDGLSITTGRIEAGQPVPLATITDLFRQALRALGWTGPVDIDARQLAIAKNDPQRLNNLFFVTRKARLDRYNLTSVQRQAVNARVNNPNLWDLNKNTFTPQEAFSVEATYEYLVNQGFTVLYTQRNKPITLLDTNTIVVNQGPDLLATKVVDGVEQFYVVEIKGGVQETMINRSRLRSKVGGVRRTQLTRLWISVNAETRYLDALSNAQDPLIRQSAQLIRNVRGGGNYNALIFGAGPNPKWGKIDQTLEEIVSPTDASSVQAIKIAR